MRRQSSYSRRQFFRVGAAGVATTMVVASGRDRKSTRLNSSHGYISYAVFCLKKKKSKASQNRLCHSRTSTCLQTRSEKRQPRRTRVPRRSRDAPVCAVLDSTVVTKTRNGTNR